MRNLTVDMVFDWCVRVLTYGGHHLGMSYRAINVWVFCVVWPLFTLLLLGIIVLQRRQLQKQKQFRII
jgi:hypothetical protein